MENQVIIYPNIKAYNQGGYITINNVYYPLNQAIAVPSGPTILEITLMWQYDTLFPYMSKINGIRTDGSKERLLKTNKSAEYTYHKEVILEPGVYHLEVDIRGESQLWLQRFEEKTKRDQKYVLPIYKGILAGSFALMLIILGVLFFNYAYVMQSYPYFFLSGGVTVSIFGLFMLIIYILYLSIKMKSRLKKEDWIPLNINIGVWRRGVIFWIDLRKEEVHVNK